MWRVSPCPASQFSLGVCRRGRRARRESAVVWVGPGSLSNLPMHCFYAELQSRAGSVSVAVKSNIHKFRTFFPQCQWWLIPEIALYVTVLRIVLLSSAAWLFKRRSVSEEWSLARPVGEVPYATRSPAVSGADLSNIRCVRDWGFLRDRQYPNTVAGAMEMLLQRAEGEGQSKLASTIQPSGIDNDRASPPHG